MRLSLAASAFTVALVVTRASYADETDPQKAVAEALFQKGQALVLQHNYAEACPKLAESVRLDPGLGAMLWLADCYENNGQTASAWAQFREAASLAAERKDPRETVAKRRATNLEAKLSTLTVVTPRGAALPGLEVRRDGVLVSSAELGVAVPVDPGVHAIAASAPAHKPWSATLEIPLGRREPLVVNVPVLEEDAAPAPIPVPAPVQASPPIQAPVPAPVTERRWSTAQVVGVSAAGVGVIGGVVGTILGLAAKSALNSSNANGHCLADDECDASGAANRHSALHLATGSTVAFVAGGVLLAGGATLFMLAPSLSTHDAGLVFRRRF